MNDKLEELRTEHLEAVKHKDFLRRKIISMQYNEWLVNISNKYNLNIRLFDLNLIRDWDYFDKTLSNVNEYLADIKNDLEFSMELIPYE